MIISSIVCDVCGDPLPVREKQTAFGTVYLYKNFKTKVIDTSAVLPHLCEGCALKIDNQIMEAKLRMLESLKR